MNPLLESLLAKESPSKRRHIRTAIRWLQQHNFMNPNATPENIAAAQRAVAEQTREAAAELERSRAKTAPSAAEKAAASVAALSAAPPAPPVILSGTLIVRAVDGVDSSDSQVVTLATQDGIMLDLLTHDPAFRVIGAEFTFEVRPVIAEKPPTVTEVASGTETQQFGELKPINPVNPEPEPENIKDLSGGGGEVKGEPEPGAGSTDSTPEGHPLVERGAGEQDATPRVEN